MRSLNCLSRYYIVLHLVVKGYNVQDLLLDGYSASQALEQLHDKVVVMPTLTDKQKSVISERMAVS